MSFKPNTAAAAPAGTCADIREIEPAQVVVFLTLGHESAGERLLARITRKSWVTRGLDVGQAVFAQIKAVALIRRGV